ncbi:MAG: GxxExxY protein [Planctomycetota bacterium]|nr:MAG: GxxExxY protein [Planctomycetota bacterium]RKY14174.1 MAG: GxxExxY protein [Planctomycetota bacterium]
MQESTQNKKLIYEDETFAIRGAVFDVYKEMSNGFLESVYQECLEKELTIKKIPFVAQPGLKLVYKDQPLQQTYRPDLICYGKIIVELKATKDISDEHKAQLINYLKATGLKLGLIVNFGHYPKVQIERFVL